MSGGDFGNRSWRIETPKGPALQKLYRERAGTLSVLVREAMIRAARSKTSQRAVARRATERRMLRLWRDHGVDVPADWTDDLPQFAAPDVAVLEFVEGGVPLWDVLVQRSLTPERRAGVLRRWSQSWGRRHAEALRAGEAGLVQEHGSIRHALVTDARIVAIDLEQAFLPRDDVLPLVAKEVASVLRSLWKRVGADVCAADLAVIVDAYPDPGILRASADTYLRARGARRLLWALDRAVRSERRRRNKYGVLALLDDVLRARGA